MTNEISLNFHIANGQVALDVTFDDKYKVTAFHNNVEFTLPVHNTHLYSDAVDAVLKKGSDLFLNDSTIKERISVNGGMVRITTDMPDLLL